MALQTINPTTTEAWKKLQEHFITVQTKHLKDLFSEHPERVEDMSIKWEDFLSTIQKIESPALLKHI